MINLSKASKLIYTFLLISGISSPANADPVQDPCQGLLNLVDRPSAADSACVVPFKKAVVELGYQYQQTSHPTGWQQNFPDAEIRVGLPLRNEFTILLPNYIHQSIAPRYGNTAPTMGVKHEIGYNQNWLGSVEALFTLPSGSSAFGSNGLGTALNGIISYTVNPKINLTLMLGASTQTLSSLNGGQRYNSVNPDLVFTYSPTDKFDIYAEFYGQSKTGPNNGSGFNADGGFLFLVLPKLAIDLEAGQRISGALGGFNHYIGTGLSLELG